MYYYCDQDHIPPQYITSVEAYYKYTGNNLTKIVNKGKEKMKTVKK